jgi:tol-pal system protein YbgF
LILLGDPSSSEGKMQKTSWKKGWIILWAVVCLYGCATTEDVRILDAESRKLNSQLNTLQKETESVKKDLSTFQKVVERDVSTLQTDLNGEMKKLQADLLLRLDTLQSEIRVLSTGVEEYKEFLKRPSKDINQIKEDIALRTRLLEERGKAYEEKNKTLEDRTRILEEQIKGLEDRLKGLDGKMDGFISKQTEAEKSASTKEVPSEIKGVSARVGDLYRDAYETFQKGDLEGARRKFEVFLKQYPNTELSDNAQFWIGETYYLKKDFEKAILEYEKAIVKYPEGDKIPAALLKQAIAFLELGDKTNARNLLKRVVERYPHSDQAEIAKKRLESIK